MDGKRAFFVVGPESSGTRLLTRVLIQSGCFGDDGHQQQMDDLDFSRRPARIVLRRSVPHRNQWPDVGRIVRRMERAGYEVVVLVTTREVQAMARSQVRAGHVHSLLRAYEHVERAYRRIFSALGELHGPSLFVVPYEATVLHPRSLADLLSGLGLTPSIPEIYDGNEKHYRPPP